MPLQVRIASAVVPVGDCDCGTRRAHWQLPGLLHCQDTPSDLQYCLVLYDGGLAGDGRSLLRHVSKEAILASRTHPLIVRSYCGRSTVVQRLLCDQPAARVYIFLRRRQYPTIYSVSRFGNGTDSGYSHTWSEPFIDCWYHFWSIPSISAWKLWIYFGNNVFEIYGFCTIAEHGVRFTIWTTT
jgi:hypothetical protein